MTTEILLRHVKVNAIAHYYDIPPLKQLADTKIQNILETNVEQEDFTMVKVISDFALDILRNLIAAYKAKEELYTQKLQAAESRLRSIENDYTYEKSLRDHESTRTDHVIENINDCLKMLDKTKTCRNPRCDAEFTCYIEQGGTVIEPKYILRCARCRCRHKGD